MVFTEHPQYAWQDGFPHHGVDAQVVGDLLALLYLKYDDLAPAKIVEAARPRTSPLHPFIEWNTKTAAREYQLKQAAQLRSSVRIVAYFIDPTPREALVQAFIAHPTAKRDLKTGAHRFVPLAEVLAHPQARVAHVARALQEYLAWRRRYSNLRELEGVFAAADLEAQKLAEALEEAQLVGVGD